MTNIIIFILIFILIYVGVAVDKSNKYIFYGLAGIIAIYCLLPKKYKSIIGSAITIKGDINRNLLGDLENSGLLKYIQDTVYNFKSIPNAKENFINYYKSFCQDIKKLYEVSDDTFYIYIDNCNIIGKLLTNIAVSEIHPDFYTEFYDFYISLLLMTFMKIKNDINVNLYIYHVVRGKNFPINLNNKEYYFSDIGEKIKNCLKILYPKCLKTKSEKYIKYHVITTPDNNCIFYNNTNKSIEDWGLNDFSKLNKRIDEVSKKLDIYKNMYVFYKAYNDKYNSTEQKVNQFLRLKLEDIDERDVIMEYIKSSVDDLVLYMLAINHIKQSNNKKTNKYIIFSYDKGEDIVALLGCGFNIKNLNDYKLSVNENNTIEENTEYLELDTVDIPLNDIIENYKIKSIIDKNIFNVIINFNDSGNSKRQRRQLELETDIIIPSHVIFDPTPYKDVDISTLDGATKRMIKSGGPKLRYSENRGGSLTPLNVNDVKNFQLN